MARAAVGTRVRTSLRMLGRLSFNGQTVPFVGGEGTSRGLYVYLCAFVYLVLVTVPRDADSTPSGTDKTKSTSRRHKAM